MKDDLPKSAAEHIKNGIWLAINSGGKGRQGHGLKRNKDAVGQYKISWPILLDETGAVGRAYDATRTPHMYVINTDGVLVYRRSGQQSRRRIRQAVHQLPHRRVGAYFSKKAVTPNTTKSWGCSIKYAQ